MSKVISIYKSILLLLLVVVSSSAMAEWVKAGRNDNYEPVIIIAYADPASIQKTGNIVKMKVLIEYQPVEIVVDGKKYKSTIAKAWSEESSQGGFDCKNKLSGASDIYDWVPVSPGSIDEGLWKIVCGNK